MSGVCRRTLLAIAAAAILGAAPSMGQQPPGPPPPQPSEELRARYDELAEIRARLFELLARAVDEDPGLAERHSSLERAQAEAMVALEPETPKRRERLRELEEAYRRALVADDGTGARRLLREARELHRALEATATEAARRPDLARDREAFRDDVVSRLAELDPDAASLMERADALADALVAAALEAWTR